MTNQPSRPGRHFKFDPVETDAESAEASDSPQGKVTGEAQPAREEHEGSKDPVTPDAAADGRDGKFVDPGKDSAGVKPSDDAGDMPPLSEFSSDHPGLIRKRKSYHRKAKRRIRIALIVLAVLVVLIGAGAAAFAVLVNSGASSIHHASEAKDLDVADDASSVDNGKTVEYNGTTYRYNENVVSIVVIGYDRRANQEADEKAGQADAVMVVALDTETGKVNVIGIPRDTMVDVDEILGDSYAGQSQLQLALSFAYGDGYESSSENVMRSVSRILYNMPMNYYFSLNMQGVGPLNDAVGGVSLTPIATIPNSSVVEGQPTTLYGNNALRYVQWRDMETLTASLNRQQRQVQYLQAFFQQAMSYAKGNPGSLIELFKTSQQYATTNLSLGEFSFLALRLLQNGTPQLNVTTLQGQATDGGRYMEYYLDQDNVYQTVLNVFYTPVEGNDDSASE